MAKTSDTSTLLAVPTKTARLSIETTLSPEGMRYHAAILEGFAAKPTTSATHAATLRQTALAWRAASYEAR